MQRKHLTDAKKLAKGGKYKEAIEVLELFSVDANDKESTTLLVENYNNFAMVLIGEHNTGLALESLRKAESYTMVSSSLRAKTLNNIGCCYKHQRKAALALMYLNKALLVKPSGDTHMNICAVLSMDGKHQKALEEAMYAVVLIQDEFIESVYVTQEIHQKRCETLAISYHNLAVELEHLKRVQESILFYRKAAETFQKHSLSSSNLSEILKKDLENALKAAVELESQAKLPESENKTPKNKNTTKRYSQSKSPINHDRLPEKYQQNTYNITENSEPALNYFAKGRKFTATLVKKSDLLKVNEENSFEDKDFLPHFAQTERVKFDFEPNILSKSVVPKERKKFDSDDVFSNLFNDFTRNRPKLIKSQTTANGFKNPNPPKYLMSRTSLQPLTKNPEKDT